MTRSHGGRRPGAGRPKGSKSRETKTKKGLERLYKLEEQGKIKILPLDYMLQVLGDPKAGVDRRDRMASAAAPYCHPKLQSVVIKGDKKDPLVTVTATMTPKEAAQAYAQMVKDEEAGDE